MFVRSFIHSTSPSITHSLTLTSLTHSLTRAVALNQSDQCAVVHNNQPSLLHSQWAAHPTTDTIHPYHEHAYSAAHSRFVGGWVSGWVVDSGSHCDCAPRPHPHTHTHLLWLQQRTSQVVSQSVSQSVSQPQPRTQPRTQPPSLTHTYTHTHTVKSMLSVLFVSVRPSVCVLCASVSSVLVVVVATRSVFIRACGSRRVESPHVLRLPVDLPAETCRLVDVAYPLKRVHWQLT